MAYQIVGKLTKCVLFILVPFFVYVYMIHYCLYSIKRFSFPDSRLCFLSDFLFTGSLFTYVSLELIYQLQSILFVKFLLQSHNYLDFHKTYLNDRWYIQIDLVEWQIVPVGLQKEWSSSQHNQLSSKSKYQITNRKIH